MSTEEWQDLALNNRRIPHGRLGKGGRMGRGAEFKPQNAFGAYDLQLKTRSKKQEDSTSGGFIEIHGFDGTEQGFLCSFRLGRTIQGVLLLAGSRKVLKRVIVAAESEGEECGENEYSQDGTDSDPSNAELRANLRSESQGDGSKGHEDEMADAIQANDPEPVDDSTDVANVDEQQNARVAAFEKNSFRSPKFWGRWKGQVKLEADELAIEEDSTYLVFDKNNCSSFSGTISSEKLEWKNVAVTGRKIKSRVAPALVSWNDYAVDGSKNKNT